MEEGEEKCDEKAGEEAALTLGLSLLRMAIAAWLLTVDDQS